jgi:uncharacterized protein
MIELLFKWIILPAILIYAALSVLLFWQQERILFIPERLPADFRFDALPQPHTEIFIPLRDGEQLHALWFPGEGQGFGQTGFQFFDALPSDGEVSSPDLAKSEEPSITGNEIAEYDELPSVLKSNNAASPAQSVHATPEAPMSVVIAGGTGQLILYLHGNAGSLRGWGSIASYYKALGYDFLIPDYRGFGKSSGRIRSEAQFLDDTRELWQWVLQYYEPEDIVVIGYSIGSAPAAMLGAEGNPRMVILKAPLYNARKLKAAYYPIFPDFLLRYSLDTAGFLQHTTSQVHLLHGDADEIIPVSHSRALSAYLKPGDELILLPGQTHNGMNHNPDYYGVLRRILN